MRKAYLASIVPVIVNAVLNEHQVIVDIVAFVSKGDFPRSRLGEKQRGKILAGWVTRKMRTIAQFGIRDADGADSQITEVAEPRSGVGSVIGKGSSLRNVETIGAGTVRSEETQEPAKQNYALPTGISEMPTAEYESSIVESPPVPTEIEDRDNTPTEQRNPYYFPQKNAPYSPHDPSPPELSANSYPDFSDSPFRHELSATSYHPELESPPFHSELAANPYHSASESPPETDPAEPEFEIIPPKSHSRPRPGPTGRDSLPSQRIPQPLSPPPRATTRQNAAHDGPSTANLGKLRIANASSDDERDRDDWPPEAIMHMNLASGKSERRQGDGWGGYDGRGYGNAI